MTAPRIFSDTARQARMRRADAMPADDRWIVARMAAELCVRLSAITRPMQSVLLVGLGADMLAAAPELAGKALTMATPSQHTLFREDRLDMGDGAFDAVIACGTLDSVNDLPGALILMRRSLKPGGVLLAAFAGAGSLPTLRRIFQMAEDEAGDAAIARFHPMIDVRAAGDLLGRAGYTDHVADIDTIAVTYKALPRLIRDLRGAAMTNLLRDHHPLSRRAMARLEAATERLKSDDGRFLEEIALLYLTGWRQDQS